MIIPQYDCILIPGGGLLADGSLPPWTISRLEDCLDRLDDTDRIGLLSGGTVHKPPPVDADNYPYFESRVAAEFLISKGVGAERILTEISSYDTIGNAYFSRLLMAEPLELKNLLVITSEFHLPRTRLIFDWIYHLTPRAYPFNLDYQGSPDLGLPRQALMARKSKEEKSIASLRETMPKLQTLKDVHRWLYTEHQAYTPGSRPEAISSEELESY